MSEVKRGKVKMLLSFETKLIIQLIHLKTTGLLKVMRVSPKEGKMFTSVFGGRKCLGKEKGFSDKLRRIGMIRRFGQFNIEALRKERKLRNDPLVLAMFN